MIFINYCDVTNDVKAAYNPDTNMSTPLFTPYNR